MTGPVGIHRFKWGVCGELPASERLWEVMRGGSLMENVWKRKRLCGTHIGLSVPQRFVSPGVRENPPISK